MPQSIAVFPAVGNLGSSVTSHLSALTDHSNLILVARNPSKIAVDDAHLRQADYENERSLQGVFDGAETLILVSYPSLQDDFRFEVHKRAINAAVGSGVKHIFYSSLAFGGESNKSVAQVMQAHLKTEAYLAELAQSGKILYTAIREGLYNESYPLYLSGYDIQNPADEVKIPHDGGGKGVAWASTDNLGEATAKLVAKVAGGDKSWAERVTNNMILLSGPKSYTLADTLAIISRKVGKDIKIKQVSVEEFSSQPHLLKAMEFYSRNDDDPVAGAKDWTRRWANAYDAIQRGETTVTSNALEELLERKPISFEETIMNI